MSFLMCVYLYYFGNNLSRYVFVRGVVSEEEQNKGLIEDQNVYNYMSESEKEFFGVTDENIDRYNSFNNLNMTEMIQSNRGFISNKELHQALSDMDDNSSRDRDNIQDRMYNNPLAKLDPYQMQLYNEMRQAQRESEAFNNRLNLGSSYRNMDDEFGDIDDGFDAGLFTELND